MCSQLPLKTQDVKWHVGKFTAPLRFSLAPKEEGNTSMACGGEQEEGAAFQTDTLFTNSTG